MRSTQQFSVTLSNDLAEMVRDKVRSGLYATESEVIRDGLRALCARDQAIETWLRDQVAKTYDEVTKDPSNLRTAQQVREHLAQALSKTSGSS